MLKPWIYPATYNTHANNDHADDPPFVLFPWHNVADAALPKNDESLPVSAVTHQL